MAKKVVTTKSESGLSKGHLERLKEINLSAKTEPEARKNLIKFLAKNQVDSVEEESIEDLITMAEQFADISGEEVETEELDELAEEAEEEAEEELEEEAEEEEEELMEEEEEEEMSPKEKKLAAAKAAVKSTAKTPSKAAPAPAPKKAKSGNIVKLLPRENKKHLALVQDLIDCYPSKDYQVDVLTRGFTIRLLGENTKPTIMCYDHLRQNAGVIEGDLFCNRFDTVEDMEESVPGITEGYETGKYTNPFIRQIESAAVLKILKKTKFISICKARAESSDKKMGQNRVKLEEKLSTDKAAEKKKAVAPAPAPKKAVAAPAKSATKKK